MPQRKVGLIGLGNMGRNHLRVLSMLKNIDIEFISDVNVEQGEELAKKYEVRFVSDITEVIKSVDSVLIVTPTSTHYEYIEKVSDSVKHIFVEKPLVATLEETLKTQKLIEEKGLRVQVGFIERFNPAVTALKNTVDGSNVINIDFVRTNKVSGRITDVDVIVDLMIHDIDLALFLNGPAKHVEAYGALEGNLIAFARASIQHENGSYSNIMASRMTEKLMRHISVTAEDMYVDCNLLRKEVMVNRQSVTGTYKKSSVSSMAETIYVRFNEALLLELMAFFDMAMDQEVQPAGVDASIQAITVAEAVQAQIRKKL